MHAQLHDTARNQVYERAILHALKDRPGSRVVDVGAGSGLLSIIAAQAGAGHVTAFEMLRPIAALAAVHLRWNNVSHLVRIVDGRSSTDRGVRALNWRKADFDVHREGKGLEAKEQGGGGGMREIASVKNPVSESGPQNVGERNLDFRADIVVHEIFDPVMLGEGVVPSLQHAVQYLAKPGAIIIPYRR